MAGLPCLTDLWVQDDPASLTCCSPTCVSRTISPAALIRTFRLYYPTQPSKPFEYTKIIKTPTEFAEDIIVFDRHLECLVQNEHKYTAISHVWDEGISRTQQEGRGAPQPPDVIETAFKSPISTYKGLLNAGCIEDTDEIWHDYISVPQWSADVKDRILLAIPDIFRLAFRTAIHFCDIDKDSVQKLIEGKTVHERLTGLSVVSTSKWFTRVWTAMEWVRSRRVIALCQINDVCSTEDDPIFFKRMKQVWGEDINGYTVNYGVPFPHRQRYHMIAPWNMGDLEHPQGRYISFGEAFALLSKRNCRSKVDFLHALLGLVEPSSERPLGQNFNSEYNRVARLSLDIGDYSPFLMTPGELSRVGDWNKHGLQNVLVWPLGRCSHEPDLHSHFLWNNGDVETGDPVLKLEKIGRFRRIIPKASRRNQITAFTDDAAETLRHTGQDVNAFIETLGKRLYSESVEHINESLKSEGRRERLAAVLHKRHQQRDKAWPVEGDEGTWWVAEAMTLSVAGVRGNESKLDYSAHHGSTVHVGFANRNRIVSINCETCNKASLFRVGLFIPENEVAGAYAYRIPGIKYGSSLEDGMGILVKDHRVVGRMPWATRACGCSELVSVRLKVPKLPAPNHLPDG